ncbi:MAG: hypothetical protein WCT16_03140 [Candidatus Buchananbacteria bacterium]
MAGTKKRWEPINFVFYFQFVLIPVLIAGAAEIFLRWLLVWLWPDLSFGLIDLLMWLIRLAAFVWIGRQVVKSYGQINAIGALAGGIAGFAIGLIVAASRFSAGFRIWKVFNLATESILTALAGCLLVYMLVLLWDNLPKKVTGNK